MSDVDHVYADVKVDIFVAHLEVVNNNNKKIDGIITRKKDQSVAQGYVEDSTHISHPEAIKMFLGLSSSRMFTLHQMDVKSASLNWYLNVDVK